MDSKKDNRKLFNIIIIVCLVFFGLLFLSYINNSSKTEYTENPNKNTPTPTESISTDEVVLEPGTDPLNSSYLIEGKVVTLDDGKSEEQIPNSSTVIKSFNFNTPVEGSLTDFTGSKPDASFILVQDTGGSGIFYYVVASMAANEGYIGTNGILLGDRISPQNMQITTDKTILVNYADRPEGAPMTDQPSVGVSKYFEIQGAKLVEVSAPTM
jgi:hypothetical protein